MQAGEGAEDGVVIELPRNFFGLIPHAKISQSVVVAAAAEPRGNSTWRSGLNNELMLRDQSINQRYRRRGIPQALQALGRAIDDFVVLGLETFDKGQDCLLRPLLAEDVQAFVAHFRVGVVHRDLDQRGAVIVWRELRQHVQAHQS